MLTRELPLELQYTYPVEKLKWGHAYGNSYCFVTLDPKSDIMQDEGSTRIGIRESTNQRYYLLAWEVAFVGAEGTVFPPVDTTMTPAYQETSFRAGEGMIRKQFFLPFENNYLRAAHMLLSRDGNAAAVTIRSRVVLPAETTVAQAEHDGHTYVQASYPDGSEAIIWGSENLLTFTLQEMSNGNVTVITEYAWAPEMPQYGLSFAYAPSDSSNLPGWMHQAINGVTDIYSPTGMSAGDHLYRLQSVRMETELAIRRYLDAARLVTPDPVINHGVQWAKVNQLRDQQTYKWGVGFSNNPPCDVVVGRDSVWYLSGSSFYTQQWSKKLFDLWFRYGLEENGKYTEYMLGSYEPLFKDDYGLNINDNTPLFIIAAHQYYSLTGDQGFLQHAYSLLLNSANYILSQRVTSEADYNGLVWCTTKEDFMRGLCGWRNCVKGYHLSGAVTEINAECYQALRCMAELAGAVGDERNQRRLQRAAADLHRAIERHLHSQSPNNSYYSLMIDAFGTRHDDMTADLLFPVLFGVADAETSQGILEELFSPRLWAEAENGGGGLRTVSCEMDNYEPTANFANYGLMGGVWPNLALWTARAAAARGRADLCLKALRGTFLLADRENPAEARVVPGELPEFFNGDDLVQKNQPRSTFLSGIVVWAAIGGFLGLTPHPDVLQFNPALPDEWPWVALMNLPYRGCPMSLIAVREEQTLYTTVPVDTDWQLVVVPEAFQESVRIISDRPVAYLVLPEGEGRVLLAAAAEATTVQVLDAHTGQLLATAALTTGELARITL